MKSKTRWILSLVTGVLAVPASYAASVLICAPATVPVVVLTGALAFVP